MAEVSPGATADEAARRMTQAIAGVLGITLDEAGDPVPQLASALKDKALLLVLDNLEHLVEEVPVLWHLVRQAPRVKLVATSRVRLRLLGEWELEVGGLPVPAGPGDLEWAGASLLFLQEARRAHRGLSPEALSAAGRAAVVRICQLTGGMPLPLVLAAAWSPVQSYAEIADVLAAAVDVPGTPLRGLPERQRRVRDVLGAAWDGLPAPDQAVLRWLPLFRGSFTRAAVRAVGGGSPQQLLKLMDLFLVSTRDGERYELNELVSRYATHQQAGRAEERTRMLARHAAYFADYVQERAPVLRRSRQAVDEIERERPNVLAAWEWAAAQGHVDLLERMRPGLLLFHQLCGPADPGVEPALQTWPSPPPVSAAVAFDAPEPATSAP
jgi:predicted ATPase